MNVANRYSTVTQIPVLIPTTRFEDADGKVVVPDGYPDLNHIALRSIMVRVVPSEALRALGSERSRAELEQKFEVIDPVRWEKALADMSLREAVRIQSREEKRLYKQRAFQTWRPIHKIGVETKAPEWKDDKAALQRISKAIVSGTAEKKMAALIADLDRSSHLVLWQGKGHNAGYRVGLYIHSLPAAIELLIALKLVEPEKLAICKGCKQPFEYSTKKRRYCTNACGIRTRTRKSRKRSLRQSTGARP